MLVQFVNFAVLAGALVWVLKKPIKGFLIKRRESVKERIDEAGRLLKEAEELESRLREAGFRSGSEIEAFREIRHGGNGEREDQDPR